MKVSTGDYSYPLIKSLVIHLRKRWVLRAVVDGFFVIIS